MVERQLVRRGVTDRRVLDAMRAVPRHEFVPAELAGNAYDDCSLPIGFGQTISQPFVVAFMAEMVSAEPTDHVLEVGAGCGYAAAVLARLARQVHAVERIPELAHAAQERLARLECDNVEVHTAGDVLGLPDLAPFDAIVVSAAAAETPYELLAQLADGGRMVIPIGPPEAGQIMYRVLRQGDDFDHESLGRFAFVPLITGEG